jgi:FAD/FMN-containing dehydrogenase
MPQLADALAELRAQLGPDNVTTSASVLQSHGRDENYPEVHPPLAVAYAERREDVQAALAWCRAHQVALILAPAPAWTARGCRRPPSGPVSASTFRG